MGLSFHIVPYLGDAGSVLGPFLLVLMHRHDSVLKLPPDDIKFRLGTYEENLLSLS